MTGQSAAISSPILFLAALAIVHRCRFATADGGVARFPGLDWFDPAA